MDEFNTSEVSPNEEINKKLRACFDGKIVRKDLTKSIKEGANVPVYVLEFLLGQYCSSDDPSVIEEGVANVKRILADNYVRPDEAQKILYWTYFTCKILIRWNTSKQNSSITSTTITTAGSS